MFFRKKNKNNRGISLVETVIVVGIFSLIMLLVFKFGSGIFTFNRISGNRLSAQTGSRKVLKTMVGELRKASPSDLGAYPIASISTSSITFFSDVDNDDLIERVRYFLENDVLKRGIIKPSVDPIVYVGANETIVNLIEGVSNGNNAIFEYYDRNYTGTSSPLSYPIQPNDIRLIKIKVFIDQGLDTESSSIIIESQVMLRNLKDNL